MTLQRTDLEVIRRRKPNLPMVEFTWLISTFGIPQARGRAVRATCGCGARSTWPSTASRSSRSNPFGFGHGSPNPAVPAALRDWTIPIDQLPPEGRRLYEPDVAEARRLLGQAGYGGGLKLPVESTGSWGPAFSDVVQSILAQWKKAGIEADLKLKEGNAFIASVLGRKFEKLAMTLRGGPTTPNPYLVDPHLPGSPQNTAGVNDPKLTDMLRHQRRTFDEKKRREIIFDIQRSVRPAGLLPLREPLGQGAIRLGALREELLAQYQPRLRRATDDRLARQVAPPP